MLKDELTFDLIEALKEVSAKFQPSLFQLVRRELDGRDLKLLDYIFKNYYQKGWGRWYDGPHILLGTSFIVQLEEATIEAVPISPLTKPKFFST